MTNKQIIEYLCPKTVLNLIHKILTDIEIKILEKGLDFGLVQKTLSGSELRENFEKLYRKVSCKRHFRNNVSEKFSEIPAF